MEEKELESGRELAEAKADHTWWYSISSLYPQRHAHESALKYCFGLWHLLRLLNVAKDFRPAEKYVGIVRMILFGRTNKQIQLVHAVNENIAT